jgi:hypothetical protein
MLQWWDELKFADFDTLNEKIAAMGRAVSKTGPVFEG